MTARQIADPEGISQGTAKTRIRAGTQELRAASLLEGGRLMNDLNKMGCGEFADAAGELALGVLTGRERAEALAHLDQCDACRENVRQLTVMSEKLLALLPISEPPTGFETGVIERLGLGPPSPSPGLASRIARACFPGRQSGSRPGPLRVGRARRMLPVVTVLLAVVVSGLGWWRLQAVGSALARRPLSSAALLTPSRQTAGKIFFYAGSPRWTFISVNLGRENAIVICQLETRDGHYVTIGSFWLADGDGSWGSADPVSIGPLAGARLISTKGAVLATASISGS
ncbi:MAG: zf-HC2 domain-containing protein [Trebonia sp.]